MNGSSANTSGSMIDQLEEQFPSEAQQTVRAAEREAKAAITSVRDKGVHVLRRLKSEVEERPYVGMGICFGLGIAAGAVFGSRAMRIAAIGAVGYLVSRLPLREMTGRVQEKLRHAGGNEGKSPRRRGKQA